MKAILAFESSSPEGGVALRLGDGAIREQRWSDQSVHAENMPTAARFLMDAAEVQIEDLGGVAVGLGPGSFTGCRVGVAFAKTLAWSLGLPLFGVSGLQGRALLVNEPYRVVHAIDRAHDGMLYTSSWRRDEKQRLAALQAPQLTSDAQFIAALEADHRVTAPADVLEGLGDLPCPVTVAPRGIPVAALAVLAAARQTAGLPSDDVDGLEPLYLQPAAPERG